MIGQTEWTYPNISHTTVLTRTMLARTYLRCTYNVSVCKQDNPITPTHRCQCSQLSTLKTVLVLFVTLESIDCHNLASHLYCTTFRLSMQRQRTLIDIRLMLCKVCLQVLSQSASDGLLFTPARGMSTVKGDDKNQSTYNTIFKNYTGQVISIEMIICFRANHFEYKTEKM